MKDNHKHNNLTDEELLLKFYNTRDKYWLGQLLERYTVLLFGVAMKYLKDKTQAADAVQHTFLMALTRFPKEHVQNVKGWLYIVVRNYCLQYIRNNNFDLGGDYPEFLKQEDADKEAIELKEYSLEQMEIALDDLIEEQRVCIRLFYYEKKSYHQIIEQTNYTYMQVKSYIQNGKRNLKRILTEKLELRKNER